MLSFLFSIIESFISIIICTSILIFSLLNSPKLTTVPSVSFSSFKSYLLKTAAESPTNVTKGPKNTPATPTVTGKFIIFLPFFSIIILIELLFLIICLNLSFISLNSSPSLLKASSTTFLAFLVLLLILHLDSNNTIASITSPINLTVFTYNKEEDFDESGKYQGTNSTTVTINRK